MTEVSGGVRIRWFSDAQNVCQGILGDLLDGDPAAVHQTVRRLKKDLPRPDNITESLVLRTSLVAFLDRAARTVDDRFHRAFAGDTCRDRPPMESTALWMDPARGIDQLLDAWGANFTAWFERHHEVPPVLRALRYLHGLGANPYSLDSLAREAGLGRTAIVEHVQHLTGLTPSEYAARLRVRDVMRQVRASSQSGAPPHTPARSLAGTPAPRAAPSQARRARLAPIDEVARQGGYRSENKFYKRVRNYTGLAPSDIRTLSEEAFERLLEERLPLRCRKSSIGRGPGTAGGGGRTAESPSASSGQADDGKRPRSD